MKYVYCVKYGRRKTARTRYSTLRTLSCHKTKHAATMAALKRMRRNPAAPIHVVRAKK